MSEICTPPIIGTDADGNPTYTFIAAHSFRDVARWIESEGGADDMRDFFAPSPWQPIATVPKDDTRFLAYCPPDAAFPQGRMMMWAGTIFSNTTRAPFHLQFPATHWMPIPAPPADGGDT